MLVGGCEPYSTCTSSSSRHQEYLSREAVPAPSPQQQQQLDLALEGKSILLQQRAAPHPGAHPAPPPPPHSSHGVAHPPPVSSTFSPLQLQLRIDLSGEQVVRPSAQEHVAAAPAAPLTRRQRAQLRRRQEQQKPADQVVFQRRTPTRPRTPAACPRTPLAMSTMSMPAAGQKFAADDAAANVFGSAEETSAAVKRLLAKSGTSVVEEHHRVTSSTKTSCDYLQDSFDFLHQRHMKNLSDVIARHQRQQLQQPPAPGQAPGDEQVHGVSQSQQSQAVRHKKQVHIHQSAFYDGQSGTSDARDSQQQQQQQFRSTKTINLSNNNSSNSSCDLDDAKMLQQQQVQQQRRCVRENSTSSVQSQSSVSSERSNSFDNCNNNFCDTAVVNKSNSSKVSSKTSSSSSTSSSSTTSSTTRVQQSFSTKKQIIKQSFSSSSQDFEDRIGIDVMLTPSIASPGTPNGAMVLSSAPLDMATATAAASTKKVKQTTKVTSSSSVTSSNSDQPVQVECKQSVKSFKSKTVKKSVSDGKQVHTDVDKYAETAEEEAEGSPDKPVITFSHVSSEGSHQSFSNEIVRFDSSALSSPSRSRSPSPLLEMPAPYSDLSKEIKRPPMEKA